MYAQLNTQIGEALASLDGTDYLVRPNFKAMASLGNADDIEHAMVTVCTCYDLYVNYKTIAKPHQLSVCASVLGACSNLPDEWLGEPVQLASGFKWKQGKVTVGQLIIMAHHCIKWGISGDSKFRESAKRKKPDGPPEKWDPQSFVAVMIDEFHMSREDAWQSTMTEFQRLIEQRQRKNWGNKPPPPTEEEAKATFDWAKDAIKRARELGVQPKNPTTAVRGR